MNNVPTDPYFPLQWYLRNTGQNGGKMRLDLNVQAAWDQGITGKNVTTAIMDDGKFYYLYNVYWIKYIIYVFENIVLLNNIDADYILKYRIILNNKFD